MMRSEKTGREIVESRFWSKVLIGDGCWEWDGSRCGRGYGSFSAGGKNWRAHRWAFAEANGAIPSGLDVCHHCDNPRCVRPSHLFAGTRSDNMRDCVRKGRHVAQRDPSCSRLVENRVEYRGSMNGAAKLTEGQVREIRRMGRERVSSTVIGRMFGVDPSHVRRINRREWWSHLEDVHAT